jgi:uncharacterized protein YjeT (DUF2065 family)
MQCLRLATGLLFAINGLGMLVVPEVWYEAVPGVIDSGPFNGHFVRDIGAVYALCGLALLAYGLRADARPHARAACAFLLAHGLVHCAEALAGVHELAHFLMDLPGVLLLPLAASWAAWR